MSLVILTLCLVSSGLAINPRVPATNVDAKSGLALRDQSACPAVQPLEGSTAGVSYYNGAPGGCPFKYMMDSDGSCASHLAIPSGSAQYCGAYCEVRNSFFYGKEVPFNQFPDCRADESCTYTTTDSFTVEQSFSFNVGATLGSRALDGEEFFKRDDEATSVLKPNFNVGATYTYSTSNTVAKGLSLTRPTNSASQCGHWTFVPIFWTSCGTMTTSPANMNLGFQASGCDTSNAKTTGNYCNTTPFLDNNGNQAGDVIFVLVDCTSGDLLPAAQQDPIYTQPGVAAAPLS